MLRVTAPEAGLVRERCGPSSITLRTGDDVDWPFGEWPGELPLRSLLISWIEYRGALQGALVAANKIDGPFLEEDGELLSALGHGLAETVESIRRHQALKGKLEDLERSLETKQA